LVALTKRIKGKFRKSFVDEKLKNWTQNIILRFVERASLYNLLNKTNLVQNINCAPSWVYLQDYTMYKFISDV
jgi:hypothetical protein